MYVEVIARQGIEEVQFRCMPSVVSLGDSAASAARIIVVFTTAAEATAAFTVVPANSDLPDKLRVVLSPSILARPGILRLGCVCVYRKSHLRPDVAARNGLRTGGSFDASPGRWRNPRKLLCE